MKPSGPNIKRGIKQSGNLSNNKRDLPPPALPAMVAALAVTNNDGQTIATLRKKLEESLIAFQESKQENMRLQSALKVRDNELFRSVRASDAVDNSRPQNMASQSIEHQHSSRTEQLLSADKSNR